MGMAAWPAVYTTAGPAICLLDDETSSWNILTSRVPNLQGGPQSGIVLVHGQDLPLSVFATESQTLIDMIMLTGS